jgi:hypothetical protein
LIMIWIAIVIAIANVIVIVIVIAPQFTLWRFLSGGANRVRSRSVLR